MRGSRVRWAKGGVATLLVVIAAAAFTPAATARARSAGSGGYDPKGVLRWGSDLTAPDAIAFDPAKMTISDSGTALGQLLYDSLLRKQPDGTFAPELAKRATIVDPQTVTVELKPGLEFQDGTPLDAAAVAFTILRNRDAGSIAFPPQIKNVASVDVVN